MSGKLLIRLLEAASSKKQERNWSNIRESTIEGGLLELTDFIVLLLVIQKGSSKLITRQPRLLISSMFVIGWILSVGSKLVP